MAKNRFVSVIVGLVGIAVVVALLRFNASTTSYNQYLVGNLMALFWVPMLTILFVFRENLDRFGFALTKARTAWLAAAALYAGIVVLMLYASRMESFQNYYPIFRRFDEFRSLFSGYPAVNPLSPPWLMIYAECSYGMYMFCWEFFFRGYLLFGLVRSIGWSAIIVQAIGFGLLHLGKPPIEMILSFGAGVILGIMALNAKSFLPCFVLHWAASLTFDFMVIANRAG